MPAFPIVRLGCTTIDPRQAATYLAWAARNGQIDAGCCFDIDNAGCWADAPTTAYTDPTTDCAAWVDLNYAESADFLGVYTTSVQGLADNVTSRESAQLVEGGAAPTATIIGGRGIRIKGYLLASSCAGMEWGKQWWRRTLDEVCRWGGGSSTGACATGVVSVRVFCPPEATPDTDGIRDLVNVSLASAPTYTPIDEGREELACTCTRLAFECVLLAGRPELFRAPTSVIARSAFSGALDYAALACDPTPVTIPAELACVAAAVPPAADAVLPEYDDQGRPSCGTGSAYYDSGVEVVTEDELGHPSSGDGSGYYLRTAGELPALDWMGRPSCGTGSADYSKRAAQSTVTNEQLYTTNTVAQWATKTTSVAALTYDQANAATFRWTGTGRVRNVRLITYALNQFGAVPSSVVADKFYGGPQTLTFTATSAVANFTTLGAHSFTVEITWEERIDTGQSVTLDWSCTSFSASAGPNAGSDRACTAQVNGPNAGVDRVARTECVSRVAALPTIMLPISSSWQGNTSGTTPLIPFWGDEGDRLYGTLTTSGDATFALAGFTTSDICAGSTILWARMRVKMQSPKGAGGTPYPWTVATDLGGRTDSLDVVDGVEMIYPLSTPSLADIAALGVLVDLAGPIGGTEGWIEYLAIEIEYVGGPTCIDCGPNEGVDVPCVAAASTSCYERPATVALASGRFVPPTIAAGAPVITIEAGTADLSDVALFAWADPVNRAAPTVDQASFDFWRCVTPCMSGEVAWMPAGSTLTIDARSRTVTLAVNGIAAEASRYLTGPGGAAWAWPAFAGPVRVCAVAAAAVSSTARVTVTAAIGEGV